MTIGPHRRDGYLKHPGLPRYVPHAALTDRAAQHVVTRVPRGSPDDSVTAMLDRIRGAALDYAGSVYLEDQHGRLLGHVELTTLLRSDPKRRLGTLMAKEPAVVWPETDQERAASIAVAHRIAALPVVDASGRLLGVLPPVALMEVLRAEHIEDLHLLSGIRRQDRMAREAIEAPPMRRARDRLPWLLIGLAGSALATMVMAGFQATLDSTVAVAFFVPGIVYLADAIGTQTEAAAVRGLSLVHEPLRHLVWGELRTGLVMGGTLAAIAFPAVWFAIGDMRLAVAVAGALISAGALATTVGLVLPWALAHTGRDPAYGSGPLATVIQDILSILIYLTIVSLVVR